MMTTETKTAGIQSLQMGLNILEIKKEKQDSCILHQRRSHL